MLLKIGVFHFGSPDKSDPLGSLKASLDHKLANEQEGYLSDSLIVLPEAFNLKGPYEGAKNYNCDRNMTDRLSKLADVYGTTFVVGIIDNCPRYSSAYLVSKHRSCRLTRKVGEDDLARGTGGNEKLYKPCDPGSECCDSPVLYDAETCIAALLCMDATQSPRGEGENRTRHGTLRKIIETIGSACVILCVPANMRMISTEGVADEWPNVNFGLANSYPRGFFEKCPSVIKIGKRKSRFNEGQNLIGMESLS